MKWLRPSGSEIELADTKNMSEFAKANGWTRVEDNVTTVVAIKPTDKVKRTRRTKAQMEEARNGNGSTSS